MYLKFINEYGRVIRYNEVKKRTIIGMAVGFKSFEKRKYTVKVNKIIIDITKDVELLHNIFMIDFKEDYFKFQSVFDMASFYVSIPQQENGNILILFGSLYLDIKTRKFYSVPIINSNVLLRNSKPAEPPFYYKT